MPVKHITAPGTLKCSANVGLSHPVHRLLQFQSSRPRVFSQPLCDHQALQALIDQVIFSLFAADKKMALTSETVTSFQHASLLFSIYCTSTLCHIMDFIADIHHHWIWCWKWGCVFFRIGSERAVTDVNGSEHNNESWNKGLSLIISTAGVGFICIITYHPFLSHNFDMTQSSHWNVFVILEKYLQLW